MRVYIILIIIVGSIVSSCGDGEPKYSTSTEYTIRNVSSQNVKLIVADAYDNNNDYIYKDTTYVLLPNKEIKHLYEFQAPIGGPFGPGADTVIVVFNDTKQVIYFRNDGKLRSIFDINSFDGGYTKYGLYKYQYYITDEDYSNATIIE